MLRKNYEPPLTQGYNDKKAQLYKPVADGPTDKYNRGSVEPFRNTSNHDTINSRLEEIKKKYCDAAKNPRLYPNAVSSKERCGQLNENKQDIASPVKPKTTNKCGGGSPQKPPVSKTGSRYPYPEKHVTFEGVGTQNSQLKLEPDQLNKYSDDQRRGSIDKINSKIKNILEGISTGKKQFEINYAESREYGFNGSPHSELKNSDRANENARETLGSNERQVEPPGYLRGAPCVKERSHSMIAGHNLAKSVISSSNVCPGSETKKRLTGKELDEEILRIQERIKKSSDERQRLSSLLDKKDPRDSKVRKELPERRTYEMEREERGERGERGEREERESNPIFGKFEQKIHSIINNTESPKLYEKHHSREKSYSYVIGNELSYKTKTVTEASCFSLKVVPIPCDVLVPAGEQIRRLALALVDQAKVDEELRNGRIWLEHNPDPNKWIKVRESLSSMEGKAITENEVKQLFRHTQDEHNPFYENDPRETIEGVVQKHVEAQRHWNERVANRFQRRSLEEQGLKLETLDLQEKGHIQMQDIVRFVNIETGAFFRNRDVVLIFKRMTRNSKLTFQELIRVVATY